MKPTRRDTADKEKRNTLRALIQAEGDKLTNAIVFCNRKRDVDIVHKSLKKHGVNAAALHGDLDQSVRMATLAAFKDNEVTVLVASDVAARGLDIPTVSHVFNYDVPTHSEDYVHRIGRTGRAGRDGTAYTIAVPFEEKYVGFIQELIGSEIPLIDLPEGVHVKDDRKRGPKPRSDRKDRQEQTDAAEAPIAEETSYQAPEKRSRRRDEDRATESRGRGRNNNNHRRNDGPPVVGMGDHVPAFLLREIRPKTGAVKTTTEETVTDTDDASETADAA